ncbi:MAG: putative quinol monooxygenase [Oricola sp.]
MIYVVATLTIKPDSLAALREAAMPCIEATREEPGCVFYDMHASVSNSNRVVFVERWKSREALENHFKMPHMKAWRAASAPLIESRTVEIIHPERIETV